MTAFCRILKRQTGATLGELFFIAALFTFSAFTVVGVVNVDIHADDGIVAVR
jgi:succinate dehydrogenase/fumarate reductase cytochrome b subunit